jgi:hypothetical protein
VDAPDDLTLIRVADSIAVGDGVDWDRLRQRSPDAQQSGILQELEALERIATFHRSTETSDTPTDLHHERHRPGPLGSWAHFTLLELIGEGAFGSVYRARDTRLQTEVALKLIPLPADRAVQPARALKEARLLARVRHTNVGTVYGADIVDGRVGIWMQFVEGQTLASLLRANGPFGAREAALIGVDLCRALAAVHAAGLIHGDVKARNVMREAGGRTVLMDFGTGRDLSIPRPLDARGGDVAGTPLYLAPEVFDGHPRSKVTDIYSLGVLLFHLVTNAYPVDGRTQADVEDAHRRGERRRLRDARPDLPQDFVALVERAVSRDPRDRFQTAGACETAVAAFLGQPPQIDAHSRPRVGWAYVAAAVLALVAIGAAVYRVDPRSIRGQPPAVATQPAPKDTAATTASSYKIETVLYRHHGRDDTRLRPGDRVAPGDELFMRLRVSIPTYVYIVNEDDSGESYVLFPLPGQAVANPVAADTPNRIPGTKGEDVNWQITSAGGREHFLIFANPERLPAFEEIFAALPRPAFGKSVESARIPSRMLLKLRGVGGLTAAPGSPSSARLANVFTSPLGDGEEIAHGLWVRQLTVGKPIGGR